MHNKIIALEQNQIFNRFMQVENRISCEERAVILRNDLVKVFSK